MVGDWIDAVGVSGVDVWVVFVLFAGWIVCYVEKLIAKVICVSYAMVVISAVPDLSCGLIADCEGVTAFDELNTFRC